MIPSRRVVLTLMTIVVMLSSVAFSSFSLFLPPIESEFGWSRTMTTVPYTVAMVGWGAGSLFFGKLADDYGTRRVILGGLLLMAAGFFGMGLSQNLWHLSISYGVMVGLAIGACGASLVSILVSKHFDTQSRGRAVSLIQTASPLNPLFFAPLVYVLITMTDWRTAVLVLGGMIAVIAFPLAWVGARDPVAVSGSDRPRARWAESFATLQHRPLVVLFVGRLSCGLAFFQIAHLVPYALSKGLTPGAAAMAVSVFGASAAAWALLFGWLSDRHGRVSMLALSYLVRGAGTVALAFAGPNPLWFYLLVALAVGPTFGTVGLTNVTFFESVGPRLVGVVLGLSFIVHQIASAGGPMLGSIIYDQTGSYTGFMLVTGLILLASGILTLSTTDAKVRLPAHFTAPAGGPAAGAD